MRNGKKFTIGLLVSGITDTFTVSVCRGVINAAKEAGVKLIIFPGKYLDRDFSERKEIFYEYQYNMFFLMPKKKCSMPFSFLPTQSVVLLKQTKFKIW